MLFGVYLLILRRALRLIRQAQYDCAQDRRFSAQSGAPVRGASFGVSCLPSGKHAGILTDFQTKVNEKMTKKALFWASSVIFSTPSNTCPQDAASGELFTSFRSGIEKSWYFASKSRLLQFFETSCHHFCSASSLLLRL